MQNKTKQFKATTFLPITFWVLFILGISELIIRTDYVSENFFQAIPYYNPGVEIRLQALEKFKKNYGEPDLLFIGSSVVRTNFSPILFDSLYNSLTGEQIKSFNGGLSDLDPDPVRLYFEKFWLKKCQPHVIIQAIRFEELSSEVTAQNYTMFKRGLFEPLWNHDTWINKIKLYALAHLRLLYYHGSLTEYIRYPHFPLNKQIIHPIDSRGHSAMSINFTEAKAKGLVKGDFTYQKPPTNLALQINLNSLRFIHAKCREHNIKYILINMPEHSSRLMNNPDGLNLYKDYLKTLETFCAEEGITFVDFTNGDPLTWQDETLFSDYFHMCIEGTFRFTKELAEYCKSSLLLNK